MLALLCLSTSAEEHVLLQDKSFPPPFDHKREMKKAQNWKSYFSRLFFGTEIAKLQPSKYFCVFALGLLVIIIHFQLKFWKREKLQILSE